MMARTALTCAHCGAPLHKWLVPEGSAWCSDHLRVCFNDECSYFRDGWNWMREQYAQNVSYRYAIDPTTGGEVMIPVWSAEATRERIVDDALEAVV